MQLLSMTAEEWANTTAFETGKQIECVSSESDSWSWQLVQYLCPTRKSIITCSYEQEYCSDNRKFVMHLYKVTGLQKHHGQWVWRVEVCLTSQAVGVLTGLGVARVRSAHGKPREG